MKNQIIHELNNKQTAAARGRALILNNNNAESLKLEHQLLQLGFSVLLASNEQEAIDLFDESNFNIVFVESCLTGVYCGDFIKYINTCDVKRFVSIIFVTERDNSRVISDYISAGVDDFIFKPFTSEELDARLSVVDFIRNEKNSYINSKQEIIAAHQALSEFFLEKNANVDGMKIFCRSPGIFSGDYVFSSRQPNGGLYILLIDFSGHGLSSALCVLPIVDIFNTMIEECSSPEKILETINRKLCELLPIKMFMAAIMIKIHSNLKSVSIWNAGMPQVYFIDKKSGLIKHRIQSKHVPLGIENANEDAFECVNIETQINDLIVMHTDGFTESLDSSGSMFGATRLEKLLEDTEPDECFFSTILNEFDEFCADIVPEDDITFVVVPCS